MTSRRDSRSIDFQRYLDRLPAAARDSILAAESEYLDSHVLRMADEERLFADQMEGFSDQHGGSRAPYSVSDPARRRA